MVTNGNIICGLIEALEDTLLRLEFNIRKPKGKSGIFRFRLKVYWLAKAMEQIEDDKQDIKVNVL